MCDPSRCWHCVLITHKTKKWGRVPITFFRAFVKSAPMPKTWNQFVTEYAEKHKLSRKEAMTKARPGWQKYKKSNPKGNSIPGFQKREDVISWPPLKKRKKTGGSTIQATTIHRVNHRGGRIIQPNVAEIIRRQHHVKRKRKRHSILLDSAYNAVASQTGVNRL